MVHNWLHPPSAVEGRRFLGQRARPISRFGFVFVEFQTQGIQGHLREKK